MRKLLQLPLVLLALALGSASCGAVTFSQPVALNLKAKSSDVSGTTVKADKSINTESGNPYGAFVAAARSKIGKDPARVGVDRIEILLSTTSTNVTALSEIFNGTVDVQFVMNDTNNIYTVGHATIDGSSTGRGPIVFDVDFDSAKMAASVDWQKFLTGSFKAVIGGPVASTFAGKGAEANFQLSFTFAAFD